MTNKHHNPLHKQSGAVVLLVSIVLLLGVTLITIFAARVGVMDQRIAANEYRHKEAKASADAALDQAASYISQNNELYNGTVGGTSHWVPCTNAAAATSFPCLKKDGSIYSDALVYDTDLSTTTIDALQQGATPLAVGLGSGISAQSHLIHLTSASVGNILLAIGKGSSLDGTANAYTQTAYSQISLLTPGKVPPVMTPIIDLSGSFTIVGDPNGGGTGVPISAWVSTFVGGGASWQTCQLGDLRDANGSSTGNVCSETRNDTASWSDCGCVAGQELSKPGEINFDIVEVGPDEFPDSTFQYLFPNISGFNQLITLDGVEKLANGCPGIESLSFSSSTIVAVEGDCSLPAGNIIGSRDAPFILVVQGSLSINANSDFYGIVLGLDVVSINGGATIHGALLSEDSTKLTAGSYTQVYDEFVLSSLSEDLEKFSLAKQKYSWTDIQP